MGINVIAKLILSSMVKKPATAMYPVVKNEFYANTRGQLVFDPSTCNHCTLCDRRCPAGAITVNRAEKTWTLDDSRCIMCINCIYVCNRNSLTMARSYTAPTVNKASLIQTVISESGGGEEDGDNASN